MKALHTLGIAAAVLAMGATATLSAQRAYASFPDCTVVTGKDCQVDTPEMTLPGLNEWEPPAYRCPPNFPYLKNQDYSRGTDQWEPGLELVATKLAPFGVAANLQEFSDPTITGGVPVGTDRRWRAQGSSTGYPLKVKVINWNTDPQKFHIRLHCTSDYDSGYDFAQEKKDYWEQKNSQPLGPRAKFNPNG